MLQAISSPAAIANMIKASEVETSRPGLFFISRRNGVLKTVKLTVVNDMLIVDGRELLDMSAVEIMTK